MGERANSGERRGSRGELRKSEGVCGTLRVGTEDVELGEPLEVRADQGADFVFAEHEDPEGGHGLQAQAELALDRVVVQVEED